MTYNEPLKTEEKLKEKFMSDIGYSRKFEDRNSPYYGSSRIISTDRGASECELYVLDRNECLVDFTFRGMTEEYAFNWCKDFLDKHNIKCDKIEPNYNSEKGWWSVEAYVSKKCVFEKYGLYDEYLKEVNSRALETYNRLINAIEDFIPNPNISDITDIKDVTNLSEGVESYFRFGDNYNHIVIKIGIKEFDTGLNIYSTLDIKRYNSYRVKNAYNWSIDFKDHMHHIAFTIGWYHNGLDIADRLYENISQYD